MQSKQLDLFSQEIKPTVSNTEAEQWLPMVDYEGIYEISNQGRMKSLARNVKGNRGNLKPVHERIMKFDVSNKYYRVCVTNREGIRRKVMVHIFVCRTWNKNPENKPFVNHINGDKLDNRAVNLEPCTLSENTLHALNTGLYSMNVFHMARINNTTNKPRARFVMHKEMGIFYYSLNEAARSVGIAHQILSEMLRGKKKNPTGLIYV